MRIAALRTDLKLLNAGHPTRWGNLGLWGEAGSSYPAACRALAHRLGEAAGLEPGARVLDCGVGAGEQLGEWIEGFGVAQVVARELLPENVSAAREVSRRLGEKVQLAQGSATDLSDLDEASFDAALALDCAYHFEPRVDFFRAAGRLVRPGGRLALTDLVLEGATPTGALASLAKLCGVPPENLGDEGAYRAELASQGWRALEIVRLDAEVLGGFAAFARRHLPRAVLSRPLGGWPKVFVTALGCGWAARSARLHYVLVSAVREAA